MFSALASFGEEEDIDQIVEQMAPVMRPATADNASPKPKKQSSRPASAAAASEETDSAPVPEGPPCPFPVCHQFLQNGTCRKGRRCPFSHINPNTYREHVDLLHKRGPAPPAKVRPIWYPPIPPSAVAAAAAASKNLARASRTYSKPGGSGAPVEGGLDNGPHAAGMVMVRRGEAGKMEVLLVKHRRGGHWEPPKRHIDSGKEDEPLAAACRELEYMGLTADKYQVDADFSHTQEYALPAPTRRVPSGIKVVLHYAAVLTDKDAKVSLSSDHTDFAWLPPDEASERVEYQETRDLVKSALDHFEKSGKTSN